MGLSDASWFAATVAILLGIYIGERILDIDFSVFLAKNRTLFRRCIRLAPHFDRRCGRFYCKFRMDRRLPMGRLQKSWQRCRMRPICPRRR